MFTVGVTSNHTLNRDIELSFSTADGLIAGLCMTHIIISIVHSPRTHPFSQTDFAAMAGLDYTSIINMPIILRAGMQTIGIAVELTPDQQFENNERFRGILTIITTDRVSLDLDTANATIIEEEGMYMYTLCCILVASIRCI